MYSDRTNNKISPMEGLGYKLFKLLWKIWSARSS